MQPVEDFPLCGRSRVVGLIGKNSRRQETDSLATPQRFLRNFLQALWARYEVRLGHLIEKVAEKRLRNERRNDQCFVLSRAERRKGVPVQPPGPEPALVFVKTVGPVESDAP